MYITTELVSNFFFLEIGHPKLRVELRRALKTGVRDLTLVLGSHTQKIVNPNFKKLHIV